MSDAEDAGQALKTHLSVDDYRILVSWMENPKNFAATHGRGKRTTIGGDTKKITKLQAFREMAEHLHRHSKTANLPRLSAANMMQRWNTYKQRFKKTMETCEAGVRLSRKELAKGMSVPEKLELCCPHFARMREMFGAEATVHAAAHTTKKANGHAATTSENGSVQPASTGELSIPAEEEDAVGSNSNSAEEDNPQYQFPQAQAGARKIMQIKQAAPKIDFRKRKLEQEDRRLEEEREERERQQAFEREQQRLEREERQASRNQELMLALINQGKSVEEIREYLKLVGELQVSSTPAPQVSSSSAPEEQT